MIFERFRGKVLNEDVSGADHVFVKALHVAGNSCISRDVNVLNINTCHSCRGLFSLIKYPFLQGDITSPLRAVDSSSCWQTSIHVNSTDDNKSIMFSLSTTST